MEPVIHKCNWCLKDTDRLIFCRPSHKVMYHRWLLTKGKQSGSNLPLVNNSLPKVNNSSEKKEDSLPKVNSLLKVNTTEIKAEDWQPALNLSKDFFARKGE